MLNTHPIGIDSDFFALGGNSLVAVQVTAQVRKLLGVKLSVRDLFQSPTISQLAGTIEAAAAAAGGAAGVPPEKDDLRSALKRLECA